MPLKTVQRPAQAVVGLQIRTRPMSPEIPALWPKFMARIDEITHRAEPDVTYGVMRLAGNVLEYTAAVAVTHGSRIPDGMAMVNLPAGTYATFSYPLAELGKGFGEIHARLIPESNYELVDAPFFERYDERFCPDDPRSPVGIHIPVKAKG